MLSMVQDARNGKGTRPSGAPPIIALLLFLCATYGTGFVGAIATNSALSLWYITLNKPSWTPPGVVFAPVWTILYGLMGWAAWLVWREPERRTAALSSFFVQLFLNGLWSWMFFGWHLIRPAFFEIIVLWLAVLATMILFWRVRSPAGALLIPYLLWLTFAAALNFAIMRLQ